MPADPAAPATWTVDVDGDTTSAVFDPPLAASMGTLFVCGHGAGGHLGDKSMVAATGQLRRRGVAVVRFNFVYREKQSKRPDPMPRLQACFAAVVARARQELDAGTGSAGEGPAGAGGARFERIVIGGRSMGGRVASMLAAEGFACDGLLLLAYPLHPEGQPEKLRDAHLPQIRVPVLCLNGTRDALCRRDLMDPVVAPLAPRWTMHWLDGADHSFHVLKSSGRTDAQVLDEAGTAFARWEATLAHRRDA